MPSFTFPSTANAFLLRGATPRFIDIRPDTLNMDESRLEETINHRTRAIVTVHYAGVGCEMETILQIAGRYELWVVEDAALGFGSTYRGRSLGTLGHLGCYSFHQTKNIISGEGGSLIVNDRRFVQRAEVLRNNGTNRGAFVRGEVESYGWRDVGSSFLPSELTAAFLLAQLEGSETINRQRRAIAQRYADGLGHLEQSGLLRLPVVPEHCNPNAQQFHILFPDRGTRDRAIEFLKEQDIHAVFHYLPLHTSPMGQSLGYRRGSLPITEEMSGRLLRLPFYAGLETGDQDRVIDAVEGFLRDVG
jgi:dTDP-4-amino-4,6-dideoxygalactose transaminase